MKHLAPILVLCLLAACGSNDPSATGDTTPDEAHALDEAAEMIEARRLSDEALEARPTPSPTPRPGAAPTQ